MVHLDGTIMNHDDISTISYYSTNNEWY